MLPDKCSYSVFPKINWVTQSDSMQVGITLLQVTKNYQQITHPFVLPGQPCLSLLQLFMNLQNMLIHLTNCGMQDFPDIKPGKGTKFKTTDYTATQDMKLEAVSVSGGNKKSLVSSQTSTGVNNTQHTGKHICNIRKLNHHLFPIFCSKIPNQHCILCPYCKTMNIRLNAHTKCVTCSQ